MKKIFRKIIEAILKTEARLVLWKYKPKIAAITGSVGKSSTKEALAAVLGTKFNVRKSEKSYNSELGVPLTILGAKSGWNNPLAWLGVFFEGLKLIFLRNKFPEWLVLELGVDKPGDMKKMMKWIKPTIGMLTHIGQTPVHVENFKNFSELAREKGRLIEALPNNGCAIINKDDDVAGEFKYRTKAKILTYGFAGDSDIRASNEIVTEDGLAFKIDYNGNLLPVRLKNIFGRNYVYVALAAIAAGISQGLNLIDMIEVIAPLKPLPGRLNLIEGIKNTKIFDDTYNSSPTAVAGALETLKIMKAKRRIAVLGDMLELGKLTIDEHRKIGQALKEKKISLLFTVGLRAKFIADAARESGFDKKKIFEFATSDEAKMAVQEKIKEGDLILVKGSQSTRMEKITEEIMAHPEKKEELLVRQEEEWKRR